MIHMFNDEQVLDEGFRKKAIEYFTDPENVDRRNNEKKKYDIYKDKTSKWVIDQLSKELSPESVESMKHRASNISICRKVVDKLARAYNQGVDRVCEDEQSTMAVQEISRYLMLDKKMQKTDRLERLHKNTMFHIVPELDTVQSDLAGRPLYTLKVGPLSPYMYNVIPDGLNHEMARCVVLSHFQDQAVSPGMQVGNAQQGIRVDGSSAKMEECNWIWWTGKYHFTTDGNGKIIASLSPPDMMNPIGQMPDVNFADDQDGCFWATGGDDLVDSSILINLMITDKHCIASYQGWGLLFVSGRVIPDKLTMGPQRFVGMSYEKDDPKPEMEYKTSNPPLADWRADIEQHLAMLLSTNNLSVKSISGSLDANSMASGIARMIDESECSDDISESQNYFKLQEPKIWAIIKKWYDYLAESNSLVPELAEIGSWEDTEVQLKFVEAKPVVTEKERLENLKLKLELGLISKMEAIKQENPGMSDEEAGAKMREVSQQKLSILDQAMTVNPGVDNGQVQSENYV